MNAKEYLSSLRLIDETLRQKTRELNALRLTVASPAIAKYSKAPAKTADAAGDKKLIDALARIEKMEGELAAEITDFMEKKHKIIRQIQGLKEQKWTNVLYERYVEYKSLRTIAEEEGYTYIYIRVLHGRALKEFKKLFCSEK